MKGKTPREEVGNGLEYYLSESFLWNHLWGLGDGTPNFAPDYSYASYFSPGDVQKSNLEVGPEGLFHFHWSFWDKSSRLIAKQYAEHLNKENDKFKVFEMLLEEFKKGPVWVNKGGKILESNLYELYMFFLDSKARHILFEAPEERQKTHQINNEILVSLCNEHGPYVSLSSLRWYDQDLCRLFVFKKLLNNTMPLRAFRIGTNTQLEMIGTSGSVPCKLSQIGRHGLTLEISGTKAIHEIKKMFSQRSVLGTGPGGHETPITEHCRLNFSTDSIKALCHGLSELIGVQLKKEEAHLLATARLGKMEVCPTPDYLKNANGQLMIKENFWQGTGGPKATIFFKYSDLVPTERGHSQTARVFYLLTRELEQLFTIGLEAIQGIKIAV